MSRLFAEAQSLSPTPAISLFSIDLARAGGQLQHFVMGSDSKGPISFSGVEFQPLDIEFEGLTTTGVGALPTPRIRISNVDGMAQAMITTWGDLLGCKLYRMRTHERFLDGQPDADPESFWGPDIFSFERKVEENSVYIEWELSAAFDQEGKMIPARTIIRETCLWRYRKWNASTGRFDYTKAKCPYTGGQFFDINDQATADPSKDQPSRRIGCCRARFGRNAPLPFGGFPGVQRFS